LLGFVSARHTSFGPQGSLGSLHKGVESTVEDVTGPESFKDRLKSIGIVAGTRIKVLRTGCPIVVHSEGGRFCLRKEDASRIRVLSVSAEAEA
jgi:Fe2+ transport system protein FeoA